MSFAVVEGNAINLRAYPRKQIGNVTRNIVINWSPLFYPIVEVSDLHHDTNIVISMSTLAHMRFRIPRFYMDTWN